MNWKPIETAPKDGTVCRLYIPQFVQSDKRLRNYAPGQREGYWIEEIGEWQVYTTITSDAILPTHWMPLPDPPKERGAK